MNYITEKKTDLAVIKEVAKALLEVPIHIPSEDFGFVAQHPYTNTAITAVNTSEGVQFLQLTQEDDWEKFKAQRRIEIEKATNVWNIVSMINTPYALTFFALVDDWLSPKDYARILRHSFQGAEFPNYNRGSYEVSDILDWFANADIMYLMSESERLTLDSLDDDVVIYRGYYGDKFYDALSWTLDRKKAEWFSTRFGGAGDVYSASIKQKHILAYFDVEQECIIDYSKIEKLTKL